MKTYQNTVAPDNGQTKIMLMLCLFFNELNMLYVTKGNFNVVHMVVKPKEKVLKCPLFFV